MRFSPFALILLAAAGAQTVPTGGPDRLSESVTVRRVHLPVFIEAKRRASEQACLSPEPSAFRLWEDGERVEVRSVERSTLEVTHAILIDTSPSMDSWLPRVQEAAIEYIRALPDGQPALIASFDDSLVLLSPAGTDKRRHVAALRRLETGARTALWDALHDLILYLDSLPGRKVLLLLSDGVDWSSLRSVSQRTILEQVARARNVLVYPLGIDLPGPGRPGSAVLRARMALLAEAGAGKLFDVRVREQIDDAFREIRHLLERQYYLVYEPVPFGRGPRDDPGGQRSRWRKIGLKPARGSPCRVRLAGPDRRLELGPDPDVPFPPAGPPSVSSLLDTGAGCLPGVDSATPPRAGPRRPIDPTGLLSSAEKPSWLAPLSPPRLVAGRITDLVLERGILYKWKPYWQTGRFRVAIDRQPRFAERTFAVEVPPLETLLRDYTRPEDIVRHLLDRPACRRRPDREDPFARSPLMVNGRALLPMRKALGLTLFETHADYRDWAVRRMREERLPLIREVLEELHGGGASAAAQRERMERALLARLDEPDASEPQRFLAAWLGDVRALDLAVALERRAIDRLVDTDAAGAGDAGLPERLERDWKDLRGWFPPATHARIVAPLVLIHDEPTRRIGFYRVVLPRPRHGGPPLDAIPDAPRALQAVRWLLSASEDARALLSGLRASRIRYVLEDGTVRVGTIGPDEGPGPTLLARYRPPGHPAEGPVCMEVLEQGKLSRGMKAVARELQKLLRRTHRACP